MAIVKGSSTLTPQSDQGAPSFGSWLMKKLNPQLEASLEGTSQEVAVQTYLTVNDRDV